MKILAVDDERLGLGALVNAIQEAVPGAELTAFLDPEEVLVWARDHVCDVAFLDVKMRGMTGLELSAKLRELLPKLNVVFATGYEEYCLAAVKQECSDYLVKPVDAEQVRSAMKRLRNPVEEEKRAIYAHTFGHFELFVDGEPVHFGLGKSKEVLAFLIDRRGAVLTNAQIAAVIWEENDNLDSVQAQMRKVRADLKESLEKAGVPEILTMTRTELAVNKKALTCDFWELLKGGTDSKSRFTGEYMTGYSWGELTLGALMRQEGMV